MKELFDGMACCEDRGVDRHDGKVFRVFSSAVVGRRGGSRNRSILVGTFFTPYLRYFLANEVKVDPIQQG